jgi:hypothetical protein
VILSLSAWEEGVILSLPASPPVSTETSTCNHWEEGVILSLSAWEEGVILSLPASPPASMDTNTWYPLGRGDDVVAFGLR